MGLIWFVIYGWFWVIVGLWVIGVFGFLLEFFVSFKNSVQDTNFNAYNLYNKVLKSKCI